MKLRLLSVIGVALLGVAITGCGTAPLPQPTVTVTTTVYTPSPTPTPTTPAFVCEVPSRDLRMLYPRPGGTQVPDESQIVAVNVGNAAISGHDWWVIAVDVASLGNTTNTDGYPIEIALLDPGTIITGDSWYGGYVHTFASITSIDDNWSGAPLSAAAIALAHEAAIKAIGCLGVSPPNG